MKIRNKYIQLFGAVAFPIFVVGVIVGQHWLVISSLIICGIYLVMLIADILTDLCKAYKDELDLNNHLQELEENALSMKKQMEELDEKRSSSNK
jgi:hypothetical protein